MANHQFQVKLSSVLTEIEEQLDALDLDSIAYFEEAADRLVRAIPLEMLARHLPECNKYDSKIADAVNYLLNSVKHGQHFVDFLILGGGTIGAYNLYISNYNNSPSRPSGMVAMVHSEIADNYLQAMIKNAFDQQDSLEVPLWRPIAPRCFDNLVAVYGSAENVLRKMNVVQITSCAEALPKYGLNAMDSQTLSHKAFYPMLYASECSRDELVPLFELLSGLHNPIKAQVMIDDVRRTEGAPRVFLTVDMVASFLKSTPIEAAEKLLAASNPTSERLRCWLFSAYREENRLVELDELPAKLLKKAFQLGLIGADDLRGMPNAYAANKKHKLANDLEI